MKTKPQSVYPWLRENLGKGCLGALTSTDARALEASVMIMELYATGRKPMVLDAFRAVVLQMQPHTLELAFHAIAHVLDWSDRQAVWLECNLPPVKTRRCKYE